MSVLGAMQPYFFPYLGYFDLINRADTWIVFDVVKYERKSWMNRNRVLHPVDAWQYITVPVHRDHEDAAIKDVEIVDKGAALRRILGQLQHYRQARAPHASRVMGLVEEAFERTKTNRLVDLNVETLRVSCRYLGLRFEPIVLSASAIVLPKIEHAGQWALEMATALNHDVYVNPPGGESIFRRDEFEARNIELVITPLLNFSYDTGRYPFVERLSIVDVLMWNAPERITQYLNDHVK